MALNKFGKLRYSSDANDITFVIAATGTEIIDLDLLRTHNAQLFVETTYAATHASTTGVDIDIFYGTGPSGSDFIQTSHIPCVLGGTAEPLIIFSSNSDPVTTATVPTGSTNETIVHFFSLAEMKITVPRYLRLQITNNDLTNPCTVKVYCDT